MDASESQKAFSWRGVPWQIWVVVVLLGLEGIGNFFTMFQHPEALIWLIAKILFITGLLRGWRAIFVIVIVVAGIHTLFFLTVSPIAAILNLALLILVASTLRYFFPAVVNNRQAASLSE